MTPEFEDATEKRITRVRRLQNAVATLLRYNSEAAGKVTPVDLVKMVVPVLRKPADEIDESDEIVLWQACDQLTQMIAPITLENAKLSIELADWSTTENRKTRLPSARCVQVRKRVWVTVALLCLALYLTAQSGAVILGRALDNLKVYQGQIETIDQQKMIAGASPNGSLMTQFEATRLTAESGVLAAQKTIDAFPFVPETSETPPPVGKFNSVDEVKETSASSRASVTYGRIYLDVLQGYLIPVLLGLIGSCAFIIRQFSWSVVNRTYRAADSIRDLVRIVQGATFGALAGILVSALGGEIKGGELSIPLVALLFGYSSDLAFKVADQLIGRIANKIKSGSSTSVVSADPVKPASAPTPDGQPPAANPAANPAA